MWEFSLPLLLAELGADESDLRWLVLHGYAEHGEKSPRFATRTGVFVAAGTSPSPPIHVSC